MGRHGYRRLAGSLTNILLLLDCPLSFLLALLEVAGIWFWDVRVGRTGFEPFGNPGRRQQAFPASLPFDPICLNVHNSPPYRTTAAEAFISSSAVVQEGSPKDQ